MANKGRVLYDNALKSSGVAVAYSGTETDGFLKESAYDYKDFSTFQPQVSATTNLDFTLASSKQINALGLFMRKTGNSGTCTIRLQYESSPSTFTTLATRTSADGELSLTTFGAVTVSSGRKIRLRFELGTGPFYVRQVMVGSYLEFEQGQWADINPPTLLQGIVQTNNVSENGAILGTDRKRESAAMEISLKHLTQSWVRSSWEPFALHASYGRGFFYQWAPSHYSSEVVYCVAKSIKPPQNMQPNLMSVSMPLLCRQADP